MASWPRVGMCGLMLLLASLMLSADQHSAGAHAADGHPVRIQEGTCDSLGVVTYAATGVGATESFGSDLAAPMQISTTSFDTNLSSFVKGDHAIVIYESDEAMDEEIACGTIGGALATQEMAGMVMPGDELAIGLAEVNGSGRSGVALFAVDGPKSTLRIFLMDFEAVADGAVATPAG